MYSTSDVILAIASAAGFSPRGIVRLSGRGAFDLLKLHLTTQRQRDFHWQRGGYCARLHFDEFELPVIALIMPGPHSFTGEDAAELQLPGNPMLLERVVEALLSSAKANKIDARRAEPGEFSARAFLHGKLSLTQAEGVAATIAAQSDAELRAAAFLRGGSLGKFAHDLADDLANVLALVEAGIDFTDQEDVVAIAPAELLRRAKKLHERIETELQRAVGSEQLEAIPWVVLVGEPNAGKSALFNVLLGHERAVVSPMSGTTRDVLAEPLKIRTAHGLAEVMLIDLAGLDADRAEMNQLMQSTAQQAIDRAELILRCIPPNENHSATAEHSLTANELMVRTKSDLTLMTRAGLNQAPAGTVHVSAMTGEGMDDLKRMIAERLSDRAVSLAADAVALRPRHEAALRSALANLNEALALVEPVQHERTLAYPELIAATLRAALDDLAALAGDITPDEVIGRIFATFCVGK